CPRHHAWYHFDFLRIDRWSEWHFCQFSHSLADWSPGYGIADHEYVVILVLFPGKCGDVFLPLFEYWTLLGWLGCLSSPERTTTSIHWFRSWDDVVACSLDPVRDQ